MRHFPWQWPRWPGPKPINVTVRWAKPEPWSVRQKMLAMQLPEVLPPGEGYLQGWTQVRLTPWIEQALDSGDLELGPDKPLPPLPAPPGGYKASSPKRKVVGRELIDAIERYVSNHGGPRKCSEATAAEALYRDLGYHSADALIKALRSARKDLGVSKGPGRPK